MIFALIQDTRICELVATAADCFPVAPDLQWVQVADTTTLMDTFVNGAVVSYVPPAEPPQTVSSQELMAQFTANDNALIQFAIADELTSQRAVLASGGVPETPLSTLWASLLGQGGSMVVTNARFLAGWSALVQILGAARMREIAKALNITVG